MYGDSHPLSSDSRIIFPSNSIPREDLAVFPRNIEQKFLFMESDANKNCSEYGQQYSNSTCQNNSGLLRFRSAPSSLLANFANEIEKSERLTSRVRTGEANKMYGLENNDDSNDKSSFKGLAAMNSQLPPQYPRQSAAQLRSVAMDGGEYKLVSSTDSSLTRQNSSPAGLFSHPTAQTGYPTRRWIGDLSPSSSRLKNHINFSSDLSSSLGMLSQISAVENENAGANSLQDDSKVENRGGNNLFNSSGFPFGSWNNSLNFAGNFTSGIKREVDNDGNNLFAHNQNMKPGNKPHTLSHHLSLPKTSAEMSTMEQLLHIQDTVPWKIRAKRGCATHPRSIAERERRTRISERIRKLQELVPNMDKQTNTSDMLDLAVEYIKNLQKQHKKLSDNRAKCKCLPSQKKIV